MNNINDYIESMNNAWAQTTQRSELHRLNAVREAIDGNPEKLWNKIEYMKPYSRLTTWTRVTQYWDWLIQERKVHGQNEYKIWRKKNARVFKNCYTKTKPDFTFAEAEALINKISRQDIRETALQILRTGMRAFESRSFTNGEVNGKGGKRRRIYGDNDIGQPVHNVSYDTLRRHLEAVGLKPHDLRKIFLSRLVELGATEFELCEVAGWSSIATASSYIKVNKNRLEELVSKI